MIARSHPARAWVAALLLVASLLAGQVAADGMRDAAPVSTVGLLGRTGFAYLGGVRRYAAAVLWARLDPVNDSYYHDIPLAQKLFLLPSIRIVTLLDPEMLQPYYVGPFILKDAGREADAVELAKEGVAANPDSALLHASYAQLLMAQGKLTEARQQADIAVTKTWSDPDEQYGLLTSLEVIFNRTGAPDKAAAMAAQRERLRSQLESAPAEPE